MQRHKTPPKFIQQAEQEIQSRQVQAREQRQNLKNVLSSAGAVPWLGIKRMVMCHPLSSDVLESVQAQLTSVESHLENCLASREKIDRIKKRDAVLGEIAT